MHTDCAEALPFENRTVAGAVAAGGITVRNPDQDTSLSVECFEALAAEQRIEVEKRQTRFRPGKPPLSLPGMTPILVDDGLATGATMHGASPRRFLMGTNASNRLCGYVIAAAAA